MKYRSAAAAGNVYYGLTLDEQKKEFGREFKKLESDAIGLQSLGNRMLDKVRNSIKQQAQTAYASS